MAKGTKKSLAEQLADLSTTTPKDYDPEDMGGDSLSSRRNADSDVESDEEGADESTGREHYVAVGKSQLRSKHFLMDDPKYKGKKSSRKAALGLESDDEEDEEVDEEMAFDSDDNDEDDDEEMASDDLDDGEDLMAGIDSDEDSEEEEEERSGSNEDQDEDEEEDDEDDSEGEDEEDGYGDFSASGITETPQEMQEELQKIQQEEKELLKTMTKSVTDDVEKGIHVKAQMSLWETMLDTRIRLQKSVALINTFPQPAAYDEFMTNDNAEPLEEAKHNLRSFIDMLITVRTSLLRDIDGVTVPKHNKRTLEDLEDESRGLDDDAWQNKAWKDVEGLNEGWRSYRNNTLEKWSNKVQIASGIPLNKKFKAMNQGIMTQISQTMSDSQRLLKRTQLKRSEYHILGTAPEVKEEDENDTTEKTPETSNLDSHLSNHDEEIFDDGDFYQQLLRELIESRMVDNDDPTAMGMRWAALRQTKQTKKQVDTKGSKGRRLRYHVHEKLQSFMAPIPAGTWHEEMVEELYSSLLGRKGGNLNDEEEEEEEQEQEEIVPDDGLRIFG